MERFKPRHLLGIGENERQLPGFADVRGKNV
jgi:hypothetical protein